MIVIRVEEANKPLQIGGVNLHKFINMGCYVNSSIADIAVDGHGDCSSDRQHPCPREDGISWGDDIVAKVCAFSSYDMFRGWFKSWDGLVKVNHMARLAVYCVPKIHVKHGRYQVQCLTQDMELLMVLSILDSKEDIEAIIYETSQQRLQSIKPPQVSFGPLPRSRSSDCFDSGKIRQRRILRYDKPNWITPFGFRKL
jgi:hypothetical protein